MKFDLVTGVIEGAGVVKGKRTVSELAHLFRRSPESVSGEEVVYETYSLPEGQHPDALLATTIIQPGTVGDEFFMTRGHFHLDERRGETTTVIAGRGVVVLANRGGESRVIPVTSGDIVQIDGEWAHRLVNVGDSPLIFFVTWVADCGHDYATIERDGFPVCIVRDDDGWKAVANDRT